MISARARMRIAAGLAVALVATLGGTAAAYADEPNVSILVLRGTVDLLQDEEWSGTIEVYDATTGAEMTALDQPFTVNGWFGSGVDLNLPQGSYKLHVTNLLGTDGPSSGWYAGSEIADENSWFSSYGWHDTDTIATAATIDVDAEGRATVPQAIIVTHPDDHGSTIGGVVGRWAGHDLQPNALFEPNEHVFVRLYAKGGTTPLRTYEAEPGSGLYQFLDVLPGDYELRAIVGTPAAGVTTVRGPGDLTVTKNVWLPGLPGRAQSTPITVGANGHWLAANFAIDDPDANGDATISGDLTAGGTVTAAPTGGAQWPYTMIENYTWYLDGARIAQKTGSSLQLPIDSTGKVLSVKISTNFLAAGMRAVVAGDAGVVGPAQFEAPVPTIGGKALVGSTLTAQPGTWSPTATKAYQWYRSGQLIDGAIGKQYVVTEEDLDTALTVTVTGTKFGYPTTVRTSVDFPIVSLPFAGSVPTISGAARFDSLLTLNTGKWSPNPDQLTYQWFRDGNPIDGATSGTYTLGVADIGTNITATSTASKFGYTTETRTSVLAGTVDLGKITAPKPDLIGTPQVGATLSIDTSGWTPADVSIAYQWQRGKADGTGFKDVAGATGPTYALTGLDSGKTIRLQVHVTKDNYTTVDRTTLPTAPVTG